MTSPAWDPPRSARLAMPVALVVVVVLTATVAGLRSLSYAYEAPGLQVVLNTADAVIALVVAYLVHGRYRQHGRVRDLLLASGLVVIAVANLPVTALAQALSVDDREQYHWLALLVRTLAAGLFAAAAVTPRTARVDRRTGRRAVLGSGVAFVWLAAIALLTADRLPRTLPEDLPRAAGGPLLVGHPALVALQFLAMVLFAAAAFAFHRAARRERDEFLLWVAAATALAAGARLNYLIFPSLYSDYLYTGDLLRLGFYLLLLVGAAREIRSYWSGRLAAAVARGRRDAVREVEEVVLGSLHEVVDRAETARSSHAETDSQQVVRAAREALATTEALLDEVRGGSGEELLEEPFDVRLRDAVAAIALRSGAEVEVRVLPGADLPPHAESLISICCAAVRGAVAHGAARCVTVTVAADPLRVVVTDDGAPVESTPAREVGLRWIRDRAAERGGAVSLTSPGGQGTTLTVDWL